MAVLDFKRSLVAPSTLAKGTLQFVKQGTRFKMLVGDNNNVPTEANYLPFEGGTLTGGLTLDTDIASPLILTRTSQVGLKFDDTSAPRYLGVSGGVLKFGTNVNHGNNDTVWHSGNLPDYKQYGLGLTESDKDLVLLTDADDTATPQGVYIVGSSTLGTPESASGTIRVSFTGATGYITQQVQHIYSSQPPRLFIRHYRPNVSVWGDWVEVWHSGTPKITNPTIEATQRLIIPSTAPTSPEAGKTYLYIS